MQFLLHAMLMATVICVPVTLVALVMSNQKEKAAITGVSLFFAYTVIGWVMMWAVQPVFAISMTSFWQSYWLWFIGFLLAALAMAFSLAGKDIMNLEITSFGFVIVGAFVLMLLVGLADGFGGIWTSSRATQLAHEVKVVNEKEGSYPDTDANHIVVVPEQVARHSASSAMASANGNLSTSFELKVPVLQSIKNHAYWIVGLQPSGYQAYNRINGTIPGYIAVDAEDPNATATFHDKDAMGNTLQLHYDKDGWFGMSLQRHVWSNGYAGDPIDDWTLEVDDNWKPFWTSSVNRLTFNMQPTVPNGVLTVDAQSGAISHYALGKAPAWLDRIYSAATAKQMVDWFGNYGGGNYAWAFRGPTNRYTVSGEPVLVYTKENYPVWQMELTSINNDSAVQYLALFDGRTSTVRLYHIDNMLIDDKVAAAVVDAGKNIKKLEPTHLAVHKINGRMTWVGALVPNGQGDSGGSTSLQGVVLVQAGQSTINNNHIAIGDSMSSALNDYETLLASAGGAKPSEDLNLKVITAKVSRVSQPVTEDGSVVFYFTLVGDSHSYRMPLVAKATGTDLERPFIQNGIKVTVGYNDNGSPLRVVGSYDDTTLNLG